MFTSSLRKFGLTSLMVFGLAGAAVAKDLASPGLVRGIVRAETQSTLASELVARITALPFKSGQAFQAGETLVQFDCSRYEAEIRAAKAEAKALKVTVVQNRQLLKHRAAGSNDLAIAEAKLEQAHAAVESLEVRMQQCIIKAPFDGRVAETHVDLHELPQANSPLLEIVKDGNLEVELIVPSKWMIWLRPGKSFTFAVDETGVGYDASLLHLGAVVDPISRTVKVRAKLPTSIPLVRPGMSGSAILVESKE